MTDPIKNKLSAMGLSLPPAPAPAANYVPWLIVGDIVYVSGQIAADDDGPIRGRLGETMKVDEGAAAARRCALALLAQLNAACDDDLGRLVRVIRLTGFVNSTPDFADQPEVINGASDLLGELLGDAGHHTRAAVGVAALPRGVAVEIDGIFQIR